IFEKLTEKNKETFLPNVAMVLNNLGLLQANKNKFDKAENSYKRALEIYEQLAAKNPAAYLVELARIKILHALIYKDHIILRENSIFFAEEAIKEASPFVETVPLAQQIIKTAQEILAFWKDKE